MSLPQPPAPATGVPRCARHPDREGWRQCTRCGRPACNECLVQASVGSQCRDCVRAGRAPAATRLRTWNAGQATLVTTVLILVNLAVFVYLLVGDTHALGDSVTSTQAELGLNRLALKLDHHWYRLITNGFIHFGVFHIAMNMILLYQLGQLLERALGRTKFTLLYTAALLAGSAGSLLLQRGDFSITGGASGAVFGLLGAAAIGLHRRGVNVFSTGIGTVLLLNLVLTFTIPGIAIGGHLGGVAAGAICGWVMLAPQWRPSRAWAAYATPVAVAVIAVIVSVVIVQHTAIPAIPLR